MRGLAADPAAPDRLREFLARCGPESGPGSLFERIRAGRPETASLNRERYEYSATLSALCGTVAIVLAILQLSFHHQLVDAWQEGRRWPRSRSLFVEALAVGLTFFSVVRSLVLYRQEGWLLWRYKAGDCGSSSAVLLTEPGLLDGARAGGGDYSRWIGREGSQEIEVLTRVELRPLPAPRPSPEQPEPAACGGVDAGSRRPRQLLPALTRLSAQMAASGAGAGSRSPGTTRGCCRSSSSRARRGGLRPLRLRDRVLRDEEPALGSGPALGQRLLPPLRRRPPGGLGGIKTWRSAHGFTRNASRAAASLESEAILQGSGRRKSPRGSSRRWICETFLDTRSLAQWLRLMLEADWYG